MNRMVKIAGITAALAATLLLGGCNEEKKYNALKMEVISSIEEVKKMDTSYKGNDDEYIQKMEKAIPEIEKIEKDVTLKLQEMEKLSKDNVNLSNDYLIMKKEAQKITNRKLSEEEYLKKAKFYSTYEYKRVLPNLNFME